MKTTESVRGVITGIILRTRKDHPNDPVKTADQILDFLLEETNLTLHENRVMI